MHWEAHTGGNVSANGILDAIIPLERIDDLLKGEEKIGICEFNTKRTKSNPPGSLQSPKEFSFLSSKDYHCQFGPEDLREGSEAHTAFIDGHEGDR